MSPTPRRAGPVRILLFVAVGAAFAWRGEIFIAALCLLVAAVVAAIDLGMRRPPPEG